MTTPSETFSRAYSEGYNAGKSDIPEARNPYRAEGKREDWERGYAEAIRSELAGSGSVDTLDRAADSAIAAYEETGNG